MDIIIIIALILLLTPLIIFLCMIGSGYFDWWDQTKIATAPKISFNAFLHFYQIAPEKWQLWDDEVVYFKEENTLWNGKTILSLDTKKIEFKTFRDFKKYVRWKASLDKQEKEKERVMNTADFIKEVQKDIDNYEKEYLEVLKEEVGKV